MARPVRPEVRYADMEAKRFFLSQWADARRLDHKPTAPGFEMIAKGTVSLAPTPEDEALDRVGLFVWLQPERTQKIVQAVYRDHRPVKVKAYELDVTEHQFKYIRGQFLTGLAAWLLGTRVV